MAMQVFTYVTGGTVFIATEHIVSVRSGPGSDPDSGRLCSLIRTVDGGQFAVAAHPAAVALIVNGVAPWLDDDDDDVSGPYVGPHEHRVGLHGDG